MLIRESIKSYLDKLSSDSPTPGGGSASAVVGALGTSLILMVAKITRKKSPVRSRKSLTRSIKLLNRILKDTEDVIDLDVRIYQDLIKSYKQASATQRIGSTVLDGGKKSNANERNAQKKVALALTNSFRLQADLAFLIAMAKETLPAVERFAKGAIKNDLVVAKGFLDGAFRGAMATARINLVYMKSSKKNHFERALNSLEKRYH